MAFVYYNANPMEKSVGDCTVRAISTVLNKSWDEVFIGLAVFDYLNKDMPSGNKVWHEYLEANGYTKYSIPDDYPNCYTVLDFSKDYPVGSFILGTGEHVIAVIDGNYYDTWDSGDEIPAFYWKKRKEI